MSMDQKWAANRHEIVKLRSDDAFPSDVLRRDLRVLDLYCAGFLGMNAASFCADAGVAAYDGVDTDEAKIVQMRSVYPDSWWFTTNRAEWAVAACVEGGRVFDLVIADPWSQHIAGAWRMLRDLQRLVAPGGALLIGATNAEKEVVPGLRYHKRSEHLGGIWWAIIEGAK